MTAPPGERELNRGRRRRRPARLEYGAMTADHTRYAEFSDPRLAAIYDTVNAVDSYGAFYLDLATRLAPRTVLDVGCGTGLLTCDLARLGYRVIGLEPSPELLRRARRRPGCRDVTWIEGPIDQLGRLEADLALMTGHVAQFFLEEDAWQAALAKIHGALKPGGRLAFESRNPLVPPFPDWPTAAAPRRVVDPAAGAVDWWATMPEPQGRRIRYELRYRFAASGEDVVSANELVFRTQEEITQSLQDAGFTLRDLFGDWDRTPATPSSPEMIFVAERHLDESA